MASAQLAEKPQRCKVFTAPTGKKGFIFRKLSLHSRMANGSRKTNGSLILLALVFLAGTSGCACKAISNHQWAGHPPPKIKRPEDFVNHLRHHVNEQVKHAGVAGRFTVPFKRFGIFGWSDLGYDGDVTGEVLQTQPSSDEFYTVDMKLETLEIGGEKIEYGGDLYLRAEICLCDVKLTVADRPQRGETVRIRGRMVWDGDGFVEIHPRNADEVKTQKTASP